MLPFIFIKNFFKIYFLIFLAAPRGVLGSYFPDQGSNLGPLHRKGKVLTIGP